MKSKDDYEIVFSFASIVPPLSGIEKPTEKVESKILEDDEPGIEYLLKIFDVAHSICKIGITFVSDDHQNNEVRSKLLAILKGADDNSKFKVANELAKNLASITDERNKTGLFVLLIGKKLEIYRIVLLRFRAEEVVYRKKLRGAEGFRIDKIEQAYSKKSNYYKVAYYEGYDSAKSTFWTGYILDRQKKSETVVSDYWLKIFLKSDYSMSDFQGTRRLADYIKSFAKESNDVEEQRTIIESVRVLRNNIDDNTITVLEYAENYLPVYLRPRFREFVGEDELNSTHFNIDVETYDKELPYQVFEMESGISLTVPTFMGGNYLNVSDINSEVKRYSFEGKLINSKFTKRPN